MKVLLVMVDGMRPDALKDVPLAQRHLRVAAYTLKAQTVVPSVTLPCHMSLFHSVDPSRHGTTTNTYMPQVRPIRGLCEVLSSAGKKSAFFYNWEEIRDLSRPNSLEFSYFCRGRSIGYDKANRVLTKAAAEYLTENETDFTFLYFGYSDAAGHRSGWMSEEYMKAVRESWDCIDQLYKTLSDDYVFIVTADHGGHDRTHGTELPEDMTIPVMVFGKNMAPGLLPEDTSIKDIAPTITRFLGVEADEEWEGKSFY